MLVAAIAAIAALTPASANANVTPTASTDYGSSAPGGHGFYEITQTFQYDGGPEPTAGTEDLRKWIIDSPAGLVGNPNAIPFADRCTPAQFEPVTGAAGVFLNSTCPASSKVGTAIVTFVTDATGSPLPATTGDIYLLQTDPEVPTTLATRLNSAWYQNVADTPCATGHDVSTGGSPCPIYPKTKSIVQPVTSGVDGDFRLRTIPAEDSARPFTYGPTPPAGGFPAGRTQLHIRSITYHLDGLAPNGVPFITYPTNLGPWNSLSYATAYDSNTNADYDPDPDATHNDYKKSVNVDTKIPDQTLPSFGPSASVRFSTGKRDSNPQVDFTINTNTAPGGDYPKRVVTTLPASVTTDIQGIANPCEIADRDAGTCPAASKVGTAKVTTPLLTAGLTGDVYMVRGTGKAIPDLAIFFNNPPNSIRKFRMDGITKFVGPNNNQIETTFDNGPQNVFTSFTVTINGGTDTLLTISKCPDGASMPKDGPITFGMTGFSGQTAAGSVTPVFDDCFGVAPLKALSRCVKSRLRVSPSYQSRAGLMKSELWIKNKKTKRYQKITRLKKSPFRFGVTLSSKKYKPGYHRYRVRAVYKPTASNPKPVVMLRHHKFKKC